MKTSNKDLNMFLKILCLLDFYFAYYGLIRALSLQQNLQQRGSFRLLPTFYQASSSIRKPFLWLLIIY